LPSHPFQRQENKRLNESNQQLSNQIDEKDSKIKKFQQTSSRLKSEIDIIMLKDEDNKLMIEQLEAQIKKFQQINASLTEEKNMAEASLMQMSSGSDAVLLERNRLMDIVNELKARVQQQQYQLEEISSERDQYRVQQHATTEKSQAAINGLAEKLETSLMEKEMLQEEVSVLREQCEYFSMYDSKLCRIIYAAHTLCIIAGETKKHIFCRSCENIFGSYLWVDDVTKKKERRAR